MARGRKPKPTNLKLLEGNPGKRKINENEPKPEKVKPGKAGKIAVPAAFKIDRFEPPKPGAKDESGWKPPKPAKEAATLFNHLSKELEALGLLTVVDMEMLMLYCQAYGIWREASAVVNRYGVISQTSNGNLVQSPYVSIMNKQASVMAKLGPEFGLSPSSRTGLDVTKKATDDPFSELLKRRQKNNA